MKRQSQNIPGFKGKPKKVYQLKPQTSEQKRQMKELDDKRRKSIEDKIGREFSPKEWMEYKVLTIPRKK